MTSLENSVLELDIPGNTNVIKHRLAINFMEIVSNFVYWVHAKSFPAMNAGDPHNTKTPAIMPSQSTLVWSAL